MSQHKEVKRITTNTLQKMKEAGQKIAMLTAYDYSFARLFDEAGIDVLLVGDSASNVMAGHETTLPITLDQMIYHAQSVIRGINHCLVIVDLPFGTYQSNSDIALASAIRIMKETGAHAIKLEGDIEGVSFVGINRTGWLGIARRHHGGFPRNENIFPPPGYIIEHRRCPGVVHRINHGLHIVIPANGTLVSGIRQKVGLFCIGHHGYGDRIQVTFRSCQLDIVAEIFRGVRRKTKTLVG